MHQEGAYLLAGCIKGDVLQVVMINQTLASELGLPVGRPVRQLDLLGFLAHFAKFVELRDRLNQLRALPALLAVSNSQV
jgi:hypothetical protein